MRLATHCARSAAGIAACRRSIRPTTCGPGGAMSGQSEPPLNDQLRSRRAQVTPSLSTYFSFSRDFSSLFCSLESFHAPAIAGIKVAVATQSFRHLVFHFVLPREVR